MQSASWPQRAYNRPGYGAGQFGDYYDPYDDYEEPRESTILKLIRELRNYRANRKKKNKKKSSSDSSDSSDDDGKSKRRTRQQQQTYQPVGYANVVRPALVTHYPTYGPPVQSIQYVMTTVPVANASAPQPVSQPSPPTPKSDTDSSQPSLTNQRFHNRFGQQSPIYQNDDQEMFYPNPTSKLLSQTGTGETGVPFGPDEENLLQTLLQARNAQLANNMMLQNSVQGPLRSSNADGQDFQNAGLSDLSGTGAAIANFQRIGQQTTPALGNLPPVFNNPAQSGILGLQQSPVGRNDLGITNLQRLNEPNGFPSDFQNTGLSDLSGTAAAIANFQRIGQQTTPALSNLPPVFNNPAQSGILGLQQSPVERNDLGITNLQRLNESSRFPSVEESRPITVWPDRLNDDLQTITLQIDSKLYVGDNIVERLQELKCPRRKLNDTPVSRMVVMLLENDDVRPENYQLVGEDNIIMKWSALMGDYNLHNGTKLRLRRRTKPGRVTRRQRLSTEPSSITKNERNLDNYPRIASLSSLPMEPQRTFSNLGSIMY